MAQLLLRRSGLAATHKEPIDLWQVLIATARLSSNANPLNQKGSLMNRMLMIAGTAIAISVGSLVPAQALPGMSVAPAIEGASNVQQATFWRWRDDWRWRRHHHRRWHRWW